MSGITGQGDRLARRLARLASGLWLVGGVLYLGAEWLAASAYVPSYSYARNYISDLGLPACGTLHSGTRVCSPLYWLMNADFGIQGLLFLSAAVAAACQLKTPSRFVFVSFAALNCLGNILIGLFPVTSVLGVGDASPVHVIGALLAIVFGNAAGFISAWSFREFRLPRIHRGLSIAFPLLAAFSLTMLAMRSDVFPAGVWERMSVYTITAWEVLSAICIIVGMRGRHSS